VVLGERTQMKIAVKKREMGFLCISFHLMSFHFGPLLMSRMKNALKEVKVRTVLVHTKIS
jgi:hypothetical protein